MLVASLVRIKIQEIERSNKLIKFKLLQPDLRAKFHYKE